MENKLSAIDLLKINVNDHTEKKNGLTYLSWAWAWAEVLKADPTANFKVEMFDGIPLMSVGGSHMVWVTVTMFDKPMTCMLPVLDFRNKPILVPNSFDVNTSIMRCLVKAIALHGLGLYIYAGEDLPETDHEVTPVEKPVAVAKPVETPKLVKNEPPPDWDNSDESRTLFAEGMIQYTSICGSLADLSSYWSSNKGQLASLKETHPALHARVLSKFSEIKKTFQG
jgi:hypothetical protein